MLRRPFAQSLCLLGVLAIGAAGCSSSSDNGGSNSGTGATSHGGSGAVVSYGGSPETGGSTASGGTTVIPTVPACPALDYSPNAGGAGGFCTGIAAQSEPSRLDMYIMLDRTDSMMEPTQNGTSTRWADLTSAVEAFVTDTQALAQDIRVGVQFFSISGGWNNDQDCNADLYATPAVEIGPMATTGSLILDAIANTNPQGRTPSVPALQGAVAHALDWQAQNPNRQTVVLLVTDGFATLCDDTSDDSLLAAAAKGMNNDPPVRTYVIGVAAGAGAFRLEALAQAGGSQKAFLVEDATAREGLITALRTITRDPLPCIYSVPASPDPLKAIEFDKVQVLHTPPGSPQLEVPYATNRAGCSSAHGGWYYDVAPNPDDPEAPKPTKIIMCPCTCASFGVGKLDIYINCRPQITGPN